MKEHDSAPSRRPGIGEADAEHLRSARSEVADAVQDRRGRSHPAVRNAAGWDGLPIVKARRLGPQERRECLIPLLMSPVEFLHERIDVRKLREITGLSLEAPRDGRRMPTMIIDGLVDERYPAPRSSGDIKRPVTGQTERLRDANGLLGSPPAHDDRAGVRDRVGSSSAASTSTLAGTENECDHRPGAMRSRKRAP